jgi:hypothetical protein
MQHRGVSYTCLYHDNQSFAFVMMSFVLTGYFSSIPLQEGRVGLGQKEYQQ